MITMTKDPAAPIFSTLDGRPDSAADPPRVILSETGKIISDMIQDLNLKEEFEVPEYVVMPDHVHILWRVKVWLPKDLGYYIGLFKARCTKDWRRSLLESPGFNGSLSPELRKVRDLWTPKFNDRIGFDDIVTERLRSYIKDNPRRRLIVKYMPDLFRSAQRVRILDREMDVFGNFQLLRHPLLAAAVVSSRYTPEERHRYETAWEEAIRGAGVLISPFISAAEKRLRNRALEEGASIIRIVADGIGPKYKPQGREFELCAEGKCLHIGLPRASAHVDTLKRNLCLELNDLARWLASHPSDMMSLLNYRGK